jgi:hypothetical protein
VLARSMCYADYLSRLIAATAAFAARGTVTAMLSRRLSNDYFVIIQA